MDATLSGETTAQAPKQTTKEYKSPPHALIWFFRKSRDLWKSKYQELQASIKRLKNRVADVTKSREQWKLKAEQTNNQLTVLEAENASLRAQIATLAEKKNDQAVPGLTFDSAEQHVPCGQQYSVDMVQRFVSLVTVCGTSLRCAASVITLYGPSARYDETAPDWSTGRLWLLRIGLAALLRPKVVAEDWVWMIDHSIQIGQCKCLVILGIRLSELPVGQPLCHQDMELIALEPMTNATKETVDVCLEDAVSTTGVPRAIVDDHGADLHGGVKIFIDRHPETDEIYDIKHMAACLLKARLEKDERWKSFASQSGLAKSAIQQTELAFLVPPSQRSKARFMNLHELVKWGRETLALIDDPCRLEAVPFKVSMERVRAKLGWLVEFREALAEWSQWHEVIEAALNFVRCRCLYVGAGVDMAAALPAVSASTAIELREELIRFVTVESSKVRIGERLPGTTEVLESCFGKLKGLEDGQSKSGFTGLVLSLGAIVSKRSIETIGEALERCRVRDVWDWCREKLGVSVQSLRKQAYTKTKCATNPG